MCDKIIIISAPSGAGKSTIIRYLLQKNFNLEFSVSACSRSMRPGEMIGRDYYFLTVEEFRKKIKEDEFLEWEEVYPNHFYGTLNSEIKRIQAKGNNVIFDVDIMGGINLKKKFGDLALSIFISPPSIDALEQRLLSRATDSQENIRKRVYKAEKEMTFADQFDKILVNNNLEKSFLEAEKMVSEFFAL